MADVKFNMEAIKGMYQEVAHAIDELDSQVREEFGGKPAEEIAEPISKRFSDAGIQVDINHYAVAVSKGEPFQFVVQ